MHIIKMDYLSKCLYSIQKKKKKEKKLTENDVDSKKKKKKVKEERENAYRTILSQGVSWERRKRTGGK